MGAYWARRPQYGVACGNGCAVLAQDFNVEGNAVTFGRNLQGQRGDGNARQTAWLAGDDFRGTGDIGSNGGDSRRIRPPGEILIEGGFDVRTCCVQIKSGGI